MPCFFHTVLAVFVVAPTLAFKALSHTGHEAEPATNVTFQEASQKKEKLNTVSVCIPLGGTDDTNCFQDPSEETSCNALLNCNWDSDHTYCRPSRRCLRRPDKLQCEAIKDGGCYWWDPAGNGTLDSDQLCIPDPVVDCRDTAAFPVKNACDQQLNCAWDQSEGKCRSNSRCLHQTNVNSCQSKTGCLWWDAEMEGEYEAAAPDYTVVFNK